MKLTRRFLGICIATILVVAVFPCSHCSAASHASQVHDCCEGESPATPGQGECCLTPAIVQKGEVLTSLEHFQFVPNLPIQTTTFYLSLDAASLSWVNTCATPHLSSIRTSATLCIENCRLIV